MQTLTRCLGPKEFLDELRALTQVVILSDTFEEFARPLMAKLAGPRCCATRWKWRRGAITGFHMRCEHSKLTTVKALQSMGYDTIAAGDSYNDLDMIRASKAGFCSAARSRSAGIIRSCRRTRPLQTCWRLSGGRCDKRETTQEEHRNGSETQKLFETAGFHA